MVPVQVGEEDVVQAIERHTRRQVVGDRAGPHVEDETVAIAELDIHRGAHLSGPRHRRTAHERHADLIGLHVFRLREPVRRALEPGHRCDPVEGEAFLPAAHRRTTGRNSLQNGRVRFVALRGKHLQLLGLGWGLRGGLSPCQHQADANAECGDPGSVVHVEPCLSIVDTGFHERVVVDVSEAKRGADLRSARCERLDRCLKIVIQVSPPRLDLPPRKHVPNARHCLQR